MHPINEALAAMEARCRLADAAGDPVTWAEFADILREARREMERQDARQCAVPKQSPTVCIACNGQGAIFVHGQFGAAPKQCSACEGSGVTP